MKVNLEQQTDNELFQRLRNNDMSALEVLYERYYNRLVRFICRVTQRPDDAVEVVNDVFMVLWSNPDSFKEKSTLSTWILGIAYNKAITSLSKHRSWLSYSEELPEIEIDDPANSHYEIEDIMKQLPPEQRAIVELTYVYGYSYQEITGILGCNEHHIKNQLFKTRKLIRNQYNPSM